MKESMEETTDREKVKRKRGFAPPTVSPLRDNRNERLDEFAKKLEVEEEKERQLAE